MIREIVLLILDTDKTYRNYDKVYMCIYAWLLLIIYFVILNTLFLTECRKVYIKVWKHLHSFLNNLSRGRSFSKVSNSLKIQRSIIMRLNINQHFRNFGIAIQSYSKKVFLPYYLFYHYFIANVFTENLQEIMVSSLQWTCKFSYVTNLVDKNFNIIEDAVILLSQIIK